MSAILIPSTASDTAARRPRLGLAVLAELVGVPNAGAASTRTRRKRTPPVVPTDCATCLSAGSVRRGVCDICGAVVA
jgi:hypothetical protein